MTNLSFNINKEYEFKEELTLKINNDVKILQQENKDRREAAIILNLDIFKSDEVNDVPFNLTIEIEGIFRWDEELEKNNNILDIMLKQNAPAILYSYMRPIITLLTVEANMPPLVIPLMNFNQ